jgi:putative flippase GtrA
MFHVESSDVLAMTADRIQAWTHRLANHVPAGELGRYLLVGVWNTLFGYSTFAALVFILDPVLAHGYVLANVLSGLVNITVAFLGYKWFVFKTKGNYLREWARAVAVYSTGIAVGTICLPAVVQTLRYGAGLGRSAPYIAGALLTGVGVILSFFGHKRFTFREPA